MILIDRNNHKIDTDQKKNAQRERVKITILSRYLWLFIIWVFTLTIIRVIVSIIRCINYTKKINLPLLWYKLNYS